MSPCHVIFACLFIASLVVGDEQNYVTNGNGKGNGKKSLGTAGQGLGEVKQGVSIEQGPPAAINGDLPNPSDNGNTGSSNTGQEAGGLQQGGTFIDGPPQLPINGGSVIPVGTGTGGLVGGSEVIRGGEGVIGGGGVIEDLPNPSDNGNTGLSNTGQEARGLQHGGTFIDGAQLPINGGSVIPVGTGTGGLVDGSEVIRGGEGVIGGGGVIEGSPFVGGGVTGHGGGMYGAGMFGAGMFGDRVFPLVGITGAGHAESGYGEGRFFAEKGDAFIGGGGFPWGAAFGGGNIGGGSINGGDGHFVGNGITGSGVISGGDIGGGAVGAGPIEWGGVFGKGGFIDGGFNGRDEVIRGGIIGGVGIDKHHDDEGGMPVDHREPNFIGGGVGGAGVISGVDANLPVGAPVMAEGIATPDVVHGPAAGMALNTYGYDNDERNGDYYQRGSKLTTVVKPVIRPIIRPIIQPIVRPIHTNIIRPIVQRPIIHRPVIQRPVIQKVVSPVYRPVIKRVVHPIFHQVLVEPTLHEQSSHIVILPTIGMGGEISGLPLSGRMGYKGGYY